MPRKATLLEAIQARVAKEWGTGRGVVSCVLGAGVVESGQRPDVCISSYSLERRDMIREMREAARGAKASKEMHKVL